MNKYIVWNNQLYARAMIVDAEDYDAAVKTYCLEQNIKDIKDYPDVYIQKHCAEHVYRVDSSYKVEWVKTVT